MVNSAISFSCPSLFHTSHASSIFRDAVKRMVCCKCTFSLDWGNVIIWFEVTPYILFASHRDLGILLPPMHNHAALKLNGTWPEVIPQ